MLEIPLTKLPETIATYLSQTEDYGPLILFGKSGMGRTETVLRTLKSMGLRANEVPALLGAWSQLMSETDVAMMRSSDSRSNLDIAIAIAFMNAHHKPVICTVDETGDAAEKLAEMHDGKIAPVMCTQSLDEFLRWAAHSFRGWEGKMQLRIHPRLLDFLATNPKYFETDKWHSPRTWEQVSRTWWDYTDQSIWLESLMMETCGDAEMVSDMESFLFSTKII